MSWDNPPPQGYATPEEARKHRGNGEDREPPFEFAPIASVLKHITGAQYLIKPYLRRDVVCVMYGDSGAFKTFLALHMGLCVAHGVGFYNQPTHQGAVYVIAGEGHSGIGRRLKAWIEDKQIAEPRNFYISKVPARLIEEGNAAEISKVIKARVEETGEPPALIIIDTLSTNFGDGDESSNMDTARLLRNVNEHLREPLRCCVLIIHHVGHGDNKRERGAYAIRGNTDERILVRECGPMRLVMESQKVKDGALWKPVAFKARVVDLEGVIDSEGEQETSVVLDRLDEVPKEVDTSKLGPNQEAALDVLKDLYREQRRTLEDGGFDPGKAAVRLDDWREQINAKLGKKIRSDHFKRMAGNLEERNLIAIRRPYATLELGEVAK